MRKKRIFVPLDNQTNERWHGGHRPPPG
jgi:hypothetical protein